jgi:tetratricopeptide (TPR) repeat protein
MQAHAQISSTFRYIAATFLVLIVVPVLYAQEDNADYSRENYENALASGLYDEAEVAAKARLDQAIRAGQVKELSTAELLSDLADVQRLTGNFNSALQNYELAVEIIEAKRDMLNLALTEPLLGIGKTYLESGRPDVALDYLNRALHVRSVNEGPHSIEQAATLEVLADVHRSLGKPDRAADAADRLYLLYVRKYSADGLELVPVLLKQGHILGDVGDWRRQRNAYVDAIKIVERAEGDQSANLIRPLVSMGNSHMREYFDIYFKAKSEEELPDKKLLAEAETYFGSALELTENTSDVDWRLTQDTLLALGDFYTVTEEQSRARVMYRSAWNLLSTDEEKLLERQKHLEQIRPLLRPEPDLSVALPAGIDPEDSSASFATGHIISQFTVTRRGKLREIGLLEISPERDEKIEAEVKHALNRFVYRPRFERGTAVDTSGQLIRYEYPVLEPLTAAD